MISIMMMSDNDDDNNGNDDDNNGNDDVNNQ